VERVSIASPLAGENRITVTHSGGLPGNPPPSPQRVSVVLGGVTPPAPVIIALQRSPRTNEFLLTLVADPGGVFHHPDLHESDGLDGGEVGVGRNHHQYGVGDEPR